MLANGDKSKEKRKQIITVILCLLWFAGCFIYTRTNESDKIEYKQQGIYWNDSKDIQSTPQIQIACFDTLRFKPDDLQQSVKIYNPNNNECSMILKSF